MGPHPGVARATPKSAACLPPPPQVDDYFVDDAEEDELRAAPGLVSELMSDCFQLNENCDLLT